VPRNRKDGLRGFFWPRQKYDADAEAAEYAARLSNALANPASPAPTNNPPLPRRWTVGKNADCQTTPRSAVRLRRPRRPPPSDDPARKATAAIASLAAPSSRPAGPHTPARRACACETRPVGARLRGVGTFVRGGSVRGRETLRAGQVRLCLVGPTAGWARQRGAARL